MTEVVKVVNGYEIKRTRGTKGFYYVSIRKNAFVTFRTIKDATAYAERI